MSPTIPLRSLIQQVTPDPIARFIRAGLLWKRRTQFRPYNITKTVEGESFPFHIGDETGEIWYRLPKDPVYRELAFIRDRMLAPGDIVFDVGSHHGLHAICMARHCAKVVAIEPNPHNVSILKKNVALNALPNVVLRQAAVGDSCGRVSLLQDSNQGGVSSPNMHKLPTIDTELVSLDQVAQECGFPDLLRSM